MGVLPNHTSALISTKASPFLGKLFSKFFFICRANCLPKGFCCLPAWVRRKCFSFFLLNWSYLEFCRWTCASSDFPLETSICPNNQLFCSSDYWALLQQLRRTQPCQLASGERWSPRSKENVSVNIFFLREIEVYPSRCVVRIWRGRNFYALKQLHRDGKNDIT